MMENKYKNGVIYKLCCKDPTITDVYVGSTCAFNKRKNLHKHSCNNETSKVYNLNVYKFIRNNGGWDNFEIIELIKYPCNTKRELELKEREYLELLSATLNKQTPTRSKKEWKELNIKETNEKQKAYYLANKEQIKETQKAYYLANKERMNETQKEKFNCECGGKFTRVHKSQHLKTKMHKKYLNSLSI